MMKLCRVRSLMIIIIIPSCILLQGCTASSTMKPTSGNEDRCGDGFCNTNENSNICPMDCLTNNFSGRVHITHVASEGIGDIAVRITSPKQARYPEGAGVVVVIPPIFNDAGGFLSDPNLSSLGLIQITFLWPGKADELTGVNSSGEFDSGGERSIQVLRDVIRFASGTITDSEGLFITSLVDVNPLLREVGVYAFSDAGLAAVNVFSLYGDNLPGVQYYVGRENPSVDTLVCLEAGYRDDAGMLVPNPFYNYPESYRPGKITLTYTNARWDTAYVDESNGISGRAYLDLDGNGQVSAGDFITSQQVPIILGKRTYSVALTQALLDNGSLSLSSWPADLATPDEANRNWLIRQGSGHFQDLQTKIPNLKVMLVFAQEDYLQAATDKPHIHQTYQGYRFEAGLWVRLNPDWAYVQAMIPSAGMDFPDNPANTQPDDWTQIGTFAYPGQGNSAKLVPLAAVSEMADRAHYGRWDENLGQVLYIYFPATEQP